MKKAILYSVSLLLVLAILAAAIPVTTMAAGIVCQKTYTVKKGDTRASVAAATGMTWAQIAALNNLGPNYKVIPGTKLCFGTTTTKTTSSTTTTTAATTAATATPAATTTTTTPATTTTTTKPAVTTSAPFTAVVTGNRVLVSATKAADNRMFFVRARDASKTTGGWFNLGKFRTIKDKNTKASFPLPKDLKGILPLTVCFKEGQSQKLTCARATK